MRAHLCLLLCLLPAQPGRAQGAGHSLRFFGNGVDDIDRVRVRIDAPPTPADIGAGDFTLEFWMKALPGENRAQECRSGNDNWITGNIIFDRDVYGAGDHGDYGISLFTGGLAFGVADTASGAGICGATPLADGRWHHVAATRSAATGALRLFVDGRLDASGAGPRGDVSYRDGRPGYPSDPFLVIGAEKHDAGPAYPSFSGWIDEVRLSSAVRYQGDFTPPGAPFPPDAGTVLLYHLDEGQGTAAIDHSGAGGGPSHGVLRFGGSPAGPLWSADTPFEERPWKRCDFNCDGAHGIADALAGLGHLFLGGAGPCCAALVDCDGEGSGNVADWVFLLFQLFRGDRRPPAPFPDCGVGAEVDCPAYPACAAVPG